MAGCKCRFCQARLTTDNACKQTIKKQIAYFCNEEHYSSYLADIEQKELVKKEEKRIKKELYEKIKEEKRIKKELNEKIKADKEAKEKERKEKNKADKDKTYYLICDIINRKEVINTVLWKEWALWNKVATNEVIGQYLEENKAYLTNALSKIDNVEFLRIKYLSTIIKNNIGDYKPNIKETEKPKIVVDETFYEPSPVRNNKRRSLADLEDDL